MKIFFRSALIGGFFLLTTAIAASKLTAAEFYFYRAVDGRLVLSNQKPPPGSTILKQRTYPDPQATEAQPVRQRDETRPDENVATPKTQQNR
jgi:hypothetical protein